MSFLAAFLVAQAAAVPATAPPLPVFADPPTEKVAEEIVVIGRKLRTWKGGVYNRDGKLTCRIKKSTGDKDIDAIRCGAMLRCIAPAQMEFDRIAALDIPKTDRNRRMQALAERLQPCVEASHEAGMRYLAEARAHK